MTRILFLTMLALATSIAAADTKKPNVLFLAIDDLRPELGCYGKTRIQSPNIDRLAAGGVLFKRAYCMVPTCGASRASLMTGIRPTPRRFINYLAWAQKEAPGVATLNTHFKDHGYETLSLGKVFHHATDSEAGWSEPAWRPRKTSTYALADNQRRAKDRARQLGRRGRGPAFESADVSDDDYADGRIANRAVAELRRLAESKRPFFLAVGFLKPHLPFVAPAKYWKLYDADKVQLPDNYRRPENAPSEAIHSWGELRAYADVPARGPLPSELARTLIHGYYACVSYTDAQIGRILDELDRLGLTEETVVVLWGDHGWNLGEHTLWCKHSCFEISMHAPLIVRVPGKKGGQKTNGLTEFIDIYPSLCELCDLPAPKHLQGRSFAPLLDDPNQAWKESAIGRFRNGDTIRTQSYRFTEYRDGKGQPSARMLYDHTVDPEENRNVADKNERVVADLQKKLQAIQDKSREE